MERVVALNYRDARTGANSSPSRRSEHSSDACFAVGELGELLQVLTGKRQGQFSVADDSEIVATEDEGQDGRLTG
ncbi:hypothetical protein ACFQY7_17145 [Actinomadura luteofluorescens]|uniref:hypothetical protein n=1 Tax=Actinomadura luteofluorescens TaxID=46163 RepID=UPI003631D691